MCAGCGFIMGGIGGLGSVVGESARLVPLMSVQMLMCFTFRPSSVSVSSVGSMVVLCVGRWHGPCVCCCGSKALCSHLWVCVWGSLMAIMFLWLTMYDMSLRGRCGEILWTFVYVGVVCVVGRVCAVVCVWIVWVPCIVFVSKWCGGTSLEPLGPDGHGAAWYAPYPCSARSC